MFSPFSFKMSKRRKKPYLGRSGLETSSAIYQLDDLEEGPSSVCGSEPHLYSQ